MRQWWSKVKRGLGRRRNLADELQQEMEAHLQFLIDENLERGIPLEEARAAARRAIRQCGHRARAKLSIVAISHVRIAAPGYSLCDARDRESARFLARS